MPRPTFSLTRLLVVAALPAAAILAGHNREATAAAAELAAARAETDRLDARLHVVRAHEQFVDAAVEDLAAGRSALREEAAVVAVADRGHGPPGAFAFPSLPPEAQTAARLVARVAVRLDDHPARLRAAVGRLLAEYRTVYGDPPAALLALDCGGM